MSDRARGPSDGAKICIAGAHMFIDLTFVSSAIREKRVQIENSVKLVRVHCEYKQLTTVNNELLPTCRYNYFVAN